MAVSTCDRLSRQLNGNVPAQTRDSHRHDDLEDRGLARIVLVGGGGMGGIAHTLLLQELLRMRLNGPALAAEYDLQQGTVVKGSNGGVAKEIAIAGAGGLVTTACTTAVGWLSPRAYEHLAGPSLLLSWEVYAALVIALVLGTIFGLIIGYRKGQVSVELEASAPVPPAKPVASFSVPFEPTPLHVLCIRALRIADNKYQSLAMISALLARMGHATPLSDIEQSLEELIDQSWVSNIANPSKGVWEYRLIGEGTAYARDRGFPVSGM